jgi:hypothetical protein
MHASDKYSGQSLFEKYFLVQITEESGPLLSGYTYLISVKQIFGLQRWVVDSKQQVCN